MGYKHCHEIVSCFEYGIPQKRKRLVLFSIKIGNISLVAPIKKRAVVADYLKQLPQMIMVNNHRMIPLMSLLD